MSIEVNEKRKKRRKVLYSGGRNKGFCGGPMVMLFFGR